MSNPKGIRVGDEVVVDGAISPDGKYAIGRRFVRVVTLVGARVSLGLGWNGGKHTDPVVTWIWADAVAIVEHVHHS